MQDEDLLRELQALRAVVLKMGVHSHSAIPIRELYPKKEAATLLGVSVRTLERLVRLGDVVAVTLAGRVLIPRLEIQRLAVPKPKASAGAKRGPKPKEQHNPATEAAALRASLRRRH